ncbi:MAG TPA: helix-turn-helix transcriptional regulator [Pseudonocardiaceae bacterium]|jgi:transcriptional regulator with XRE-family HTH domain|nr:helix-turn-helix transcriptional regulator [Pseudonocardiaceae bacterium]
MAQGTTRGKRRLGRFIKPIRERSALKVEEIAKRASCSAQTVYRLENGEALPSRLRISAILAAIGVTDEERERAWQLWEIADVDAAVVAHAEDLPVKYRRFRLDESEATRERTLDMVGIPGILQTPAYATAISRAAHRLIRDNHWEERAGAERRERQSLLTQTAEPLAFHSLVSEAAIRNMIGSPKIMAEQLDHVLTMMELPNVTIQVLPFDFGEHGLMSGPLILFDFSDDESEDAAYVESVIGIEVVRRDAVAALRSVWEDVASAAASPERSAEIIKAERDRAEAT